MGATVNGSSDHQQNDCLVFMFVVIVVFVFILCICICICVQVTVIVHVHMSTCNGNVIADGTAHIHVKTIEKLNEEVLL